MHLHQEIMVSAGYCGVHGQSMQTAITYGVPHIRKDGHQCHAAIKTKDPAMMLRWERKQRMKATDLENITIRSCLHRNGSLRENTWKASNPTASG